METNISANPAIYGSGLECFRKRLGDSKCYLEYGSGGSTIYAANIAKVPSIISIETDKSWNSKVKSQIESNSQKLFLEHCDLGEVGEWGTPKNINKMSDFWKYSFKPWDIALQNSLIPDTILIDGRFRVSTFLTSLMYSCEGSIFMFDDYFPRPQYFIVEKFCSLYEKHDGMAVFISEKKYIHTEITRTIAEYSVQWS